MTNGEEQPSEMPDSGAEVALEVLPLHSTDLLTVLDENGIIRYESPSIERIFGYDQNELVGEQVAEYFHPDDRESVVDAFQAVVSSETYTVESVEYRHEQADGTYRWVESIASKNSTPKGNYVVNTREISTRKKRERELQQTNERLEQFASVVSHDIRNPLTVAQGHLELAERDSTSEHHETIATALNRMETLIEDLLALAQAGNRIDEMEWVNLTSLTETCWRHVSTADTTLVTDLDRSIRADRFRVMQLLENLFRNAVEHGGEGVTVTVGERANGTGFYVADDGHGIPEEKLSQVFQSGYSTATDGSGLGLAIVKEIVDAHGWNISVAESAGGGVQFEITGVEFDR